MHPLTILDPPAPWQTPAPEEGLQAHFWAPPPPADSPESSEDTGASLVRETHNSANSKRKVCLETECKTARWVKGECNDHGCVHWILVPCKRRGCETCGPISRYKIAERIALGVRELWPACWQVLTFVQDIDKKAAVRRLATYVKWLRKTPGNAGMEYVATYELTKNGRLHINLICAPWTPIKQAVLQDKWGARLWVEWVRDSHSVGVEAAAAYTPEALGGYLAKLEQAVPTDRRVSYSKGWPKMPEPTPTKGHITWKQVPDEEQHHVWNLRALGWMREVHPGEWQLAPNLRDVPNCECFQLALDLHTASSLQPGPSPPP